MNWHRIWLIALPMLAGCEEPTFVFRGYTDLSSCQTVIDAELANGSEFLGAFDSTDVESPGLVTEMSGVLFDERVRIEVNCGERGKVQTVHYVSAASDPEDTAEVFVRFAEELAKIFGNPYERFTDVNLSLRFLCESPSPILLEEWKLADDSDDGSEDESNDDEVEHEIYVAIVPSAVSCLDDD